MSITSFDKKDLKNLKRYVYVPWPQVQDYQEFDDYDEHVVEDMEDDGACIEEDWLYEHTPDHEGCSYQELADWGNEFDKYFDIDLLDADESVTEARNQFLREMESGEVSSIEEFAEKYRLDN